MKTTNRIANRTTAYLLSFILTACSIPNIWANTNPENSPQHDIYAVDPIYDDYPYIMISLQIIMRHQLLQ